MSAADPWAEFTPSAPAAPSVRAADPWAEFEPASAPAPSRRESSAPQWLKSFSANIDPESRLAPLAALPEMYDIGKESLHGLYEAPGKLAASFSIPGSKTPATLPGADAFSDQRASIKKKAMELGADDANAENVANTAIQRMQRGEALQSILFGVGGLLLSPALGVYRHFVSQPLEEAGGPPRDVTEMAPMIAAGIPGARSVLRHAGRAEPAQAAPAGPVGPADVVPISSPMTVREGTNARLLPPDYAGRGASGDPHFDAAWEALGTRGSMGASGRPGGPLAEVQPEAIAIIEKLIKDEGLSPWEMERRFEERSPHHFGAEWSDATRQASGALYSMGREGANIIGPAVRQRGREARERMRSSFDEGFGAKVNLHEQEGRLNQERNAASGKFWKEFEQTPIPPTQQLMVLEDALKAAGAWRAAETRLRIRRVPRENQFVELPNTGERVLASPDLPAETSRVPTAAFYQIAKEHLDKGIEAAMATPGAAGEARDLIGLKQVLIDAIDNHPNETVAGTWREARETWAGPEQLKTATNLGKRVLTEHVDGDEFAALWGTLSSAEQGALLKGVRAYLEQQLGRPGSTELRTMNQVLSDNNRQKLQLMLGEEKANRMVGALEHEYDMHKSPQGLIGGPQTAQRLAAQEMFKPKETLAQTLQPGDLPHSFVHGVTMGAKHLWRRKQEKMIEEGQQKQNAINADVARLLTLQGPEWNAVVRYLNGGADEGLSGAAAAAAPRPAPQPPAGGPEPPPHARAPSGPPGYPQPDMTVMEASQTLRSFGYPQEAIDRMAAPARMKTAQALQDAYPKGPPGRTPDFPGELPLNARRAQPAPWQQAGAPGKSTSLLEWIRKQGGISPDDPLVGDVRSMFGGRNPGGIIRQGGKTLDKLREAAIGDKYLLDMGDITGGEAQTDPRTLLFAMELEARGQKQYPIGQEGPQARRDVRREQEARLEYENSVEAQDFDRELSRHEVTRDMIPPDVRQRALQIMVVEGERDPTIAYERALEEKYANGLETEGSGASAEGFILPQDRDRMAAARGGNAAGGESGDGQAVRANGDVDRPQATALTLPQLLLQAGHGVEPTSHPQTARNSELAQALLAALRKRAQPDKE